MRDTIKMILPFYKAGMVHLKSRNSFIKKNKVSYWYNFEILFWTNFFYIENTKIP